MSFECIKCNSDTALDTKHRMCWPCASAEVDRLRAQVTELQEANNREVERRRDAERQWREWSTMAEALKAERDDLSKAPAAFATPKSFAGLVLDSPHGRALYDVVIELSRVLSIYTRPYASLHEGAAILREEHDELWDEVKKREQHLPSARKEASQVAAVAIRMMAELCESTRCAVCGFTLSAERDGGCVRGDCSMRPRPAVLFDPDRAAREGSK